MGQIHGSRGSFGSGLQPGHTADDAVTALVTSLVDGQHIGDVA